MSAPGFASSASDIPDNSKNNAINKETHVSQNASGEFGLFQAINEMQMIFTLFPSLLTEMEKSSKCTDPTEKLRLLRLHEGLKTTEEKIFEVINEYFEAKSLTWANCVAVCTDGAAALTGSSKGFRGLIKKVTPHTVFNPCMIHRQALVAKDMDEELHNILHKTLLVQLTTLNATVLTAFSFQYFAIRWAQRMRDYCYTPKSDGSHVGKYYDGYLI
ncbi:zinc finger MYM-type protein 6 [Trichonephila clavipes]|nr:zinc finger MYM-type protein 6 [Trichonephila clavipes]